MDGLLREEPNDGRPLVALGDPEQVRAVYRGERRVMMRASQAPGSRRERRERRTELRDAVLPPEARPLFEALREWRREEARSQNVPPYVIFHDRTLAELATARPASIEAVGRLSGIGQAKLDRYGEGVLRVVREA